MTLCVEKVRGLKQAFKKKGKGEKLSNIKYFFSYIEQQVTMSNNREDEGRPEIRINKKMRTWNKYRNYCFIATLV